MSTTSSLHLDTEKAYHQAPHRTPKSTFGPFMITLRITQYMVSITTLVLASMALDRSLTSKVWYNDEILAIIGACVALMALPLATHTFTLYFDSATSILLFASMVLAAYNQGKGEGSCVGPDMIGVFDNKRACRKMMGAVVLVGVDAVLFGMTAVIGCKKGKKLWFPRQDV